MGLFNAAFIVAGDIRASYTAAAKLSERFLLCLESRPVLHRSSFTHKKGKRSERSLLLPFRKEKKRNNEELERGV